MTRPTGALGNSTPIRRPSDPPVLDHTSAKRRATATEDRYDGNTPAAPAKPSTSEPAAFGLIGQYDQRGLRAHLKAHPDEVNLRNKVRDTPLHVVAEKGAVLLAEVLDELGAEPFSSDRRGLLPAYRAAESHPKTAAFLFERALAKAGTEAVWRSPESIEKTIAAVKDKGASAMDEAAARLTGLTMSELNAPREIVKNRTHLESIKGTILEQKAEGWWQDQFVPQRVRALLTAVAAIDAGAKAPKDARAALMSEVATQLALLRTVRRMLTARKCKSADIRRMAATLEARHVTPRILSARPGAEAALALGWTGHAIYGGFVKVPANPAAGHPVDTLLIRIDNRGGGSKVAHDKDEGGDIMARAFHIPLSLLEKNPKLLEDFLADVFTVKLEPESTGDDFYARVARMKREVKAAVKEDDTVESAYGLHELTSLPAQIAGNCVVANTFPGLASRLGDATFTWFRDFELSLSRKLVDTHASLNTLIDEECKERDQRELAKVVDADGPWTAKLTAIVEAPAQYDRKALAAKLTAPQLKKIIEGREAPALRILLAHGAKASLQGEHDRTPLHWAAALGDAELCRALIEHGATVNAMDDHGDTPLHAAVQSGSHALVALLLQHGADRDRENKAGLTPKAAIEAQVEQTMLIAQTLRGGDVLPLAARRPRPFAKTGTDGR